MTADLFGDLPRERPAQLDTAPAAHDRWWRFDSRDPRVWDWAPSTTARFRFDPLSGGFRVRYAAASLAGAVLERFGSYGRRRTTDADADTVLARLGGRPDAVDLTDRSVRELLHVDERISIGRSWPSRPEAADPILDACGRLADLVDGWFGIPHTAIAYRSRHAAEHINLAFGADALTMRAAPRPLSQDRQAITTLIVSGVSVPDSWLEHLDDLDVLDTDSTI